MSRNLLRIASWIVARDRRLAAIHEAGHKVIAESFGACCQALIFPHFHGGPSQKTWLGKCFRLPKQLSKQQERMIAVAGAVAEAYWQDRDIWDVAEEIDWYEPAVMSQSDWHLGGCAVGEPSTRLFTAIQEVAVLLRPDGGPLWSSLLRTARELIVASREILLVDAGKKAFASMVDEMAKLSHQTPPDEVPRWLFENPHDK